MRALNNFSAMPDCSEVRKIGEDLCAQVKGKIGIYRGESMFPTLKEGWKIRFKPAPPEDIEAGDIVVLGRSSFKCHRIISRFKSRGKTYFFHKGDNSEAIELIPEDLIIGRVIEIIDTDSCSVVDDRAWKGRRYSSVSCIFGYLIYICYTVLANIKKGLLGKRRTRITDAIRDFYWNLSSLILRRIP
ncbi:MAG: hypothetical protein KJ706_00300 [Candidatus Omnitrophica bacterium]|nr:hypothetical protein [Candidatus Omnitrophota bacterium]